MSRLRALYAPLVVLSAAALDGCFDDPSSSSDPLSDSTERLAILSLGDFPLDPFDFGVGTPLADVEKTLTLKNIGLLRATEIKPDADFPPTSAFQFKGGSYPGTGGTCNASLESGTYCTLILTYRPKQGGATDQSFSIRYTNGNGQTTTERQLKAESGAYLTFACSPSCAFGARGVGSSTNTTITVTNTGSKEATLLGADPGQPMTGPFSYFSGSYPGVGGTCGSSLTSGGGTCTVAVSYTPTGTGAFSSQVSLKFDSGGPAGVVHQAQALSGGPE